MFLNLHHDGGNLVSASVEMLKKTQRSQTYRWLVGNEGVYYVGMIQELYSPYTLLVTTQQVSLTIWVWLFKPCLSLTEIRPENNNQNT